MRRCGQAALQGERQSYSFTLQDLRVNVEG
jgi:hypothetical protein